MNVYYLGPEGTFSNMAASAYARSMTSAVLVPSATIASVFSKVNTNSIGVVPYYNALEGIVQEAVDCLQKYPVKAVDIIRLPILFAIGSKSGKLMPQTYSHPKALGQCSEWLQQQLPDAETIETTSTVVACNKDGNVIAHPEALIKTGLKIIATDIGNQKGHINYTDFLIVKKAKIPDKRRTLLVVNPEVDHPGLLQQILTQFQFFGLNMCKIHSRPAVSGIPHAQCFYIELAAQPKHSNFLSATTAIRLKYGKKAIKILGSWDDPDLPAPNNPPKEVARLNPVLVIGSEGKFGRLITDGLKKTGFTTYGVDTSATWASIEAVPQKILDDIKWVIFCTPPDPIPKLAKQLLAKKQHFTISDIASVKTPLLNRLNFVKKKEVVWVSLHPMFAPTVPITRQNWCVTHFHGRNTTVEKLLQHLEGNYTSLTATQHDMLTAQLQAATHAGILSLAELAINETSCRLATPLNKVIIALASRILSSDPAIYADIQKGNPFATSAKQELQRQIPLSPKAFSEKFTRLKEQYGVSLEDWKQTSSAIINALQNTTQS